jgi:hypothetical protein
MVGSDDKGQTHRRLQILMTQEQFTDKLRYIFDEYFNDEEVMWTYIYNMAMDEFYKNRVWKLRSQKRWKKNVEPANKKR